MWENVMPNKNDHDQECSFFNESIPFSLRRTNSFALSKSDLLIFVVNKDGEETLLDQVDFEDVVPLGKGQQGKVYAAKIIFNNEDNELEVRHCVLKNIPRKRFAQQSPFSAHEKISEKDKSSIQNNTIKLIKIIKHQADYYALLPYCSLFLDSAIELLKELSVSDSVQFKNIKLSLAFHILRDMYIAQNNMHFAKGFVHGDVKPANVGLYCGHWCLVDMDCALKIGEHVDHFAGTLPYTSPAALCNRDNAANPSNDFYALGRIVRDILHPEEYGVYGNMFSLLEKKDSEYREALHEKYLGNGKTKKTLLELIETGKLEDNLELVSTSLMSKLETDQPDAVQVEACIFGKLEKQLHDEIPNFITVLEDFYDELKSDGYFHVNPSDPSSSPKNFTSALSLSHSLFSNSASARRASNGSLTSELSQTLEIGNEYDEKKYGIF